MQRLFIFTIISTLFLLGFKNSEKTYPKNYFRPPIDFPISLSGTFAELRPNHYHGGFDIKPSVRNRQGDAIYAVADGYVSRIRVSAHGYGNALYVTHPNGYTSVYAHLQKFSSKIADYTLEKHYENEEFELDITLPSDKFSVSQGEQIAYLGTTGGSFGPHLHFEIRDTESQRPINPLYFGFNVSDNKKPTMQKFKIYELNRKHEAVGVQNYALKTVGDGEYTLNSEVIEVPSNRMAIGLKMYDNLSGTVNPNGAYAMQVFQDDSLIYHFEMETFDYNEDRCINAHTDYKAWLNREGFFNLSYRLKGNFQQNFYKHLVNDGVISLSNTESKITVLAKDYKGNTSRLNFKVKRAANIKSPDSQVFNYLFPYNEGSIVKRSDLELYFPDSIFYQDVYANIQAAYDGSTSAFSPTFHLHDETIPIHKKFELRIKLQRKVSEELKSKLYIGKCKNGQTRYVGAKWDGEWLSAKTKTFGDYTILLDTIAPKITPITFNGTTKTSPRLSFKLSDKGTGIKTYNAWVDDQWILMKYDGKKNIIYHQFDEYVTVGQHTIKIIVTDLVDNSTSFESEFIR